MPGPRTLSYLCLCFSSSSPPPFPCLLHRSVFPFLIFIHVSFSPFLLLCLGRSICFLRYLCLSSLPVFSPSSPLSVSFIVQCFPFVIYICLPLLSSLILLFLITLSIRFATPADVSISSFILFFLYLLHRAIFYFCCLYSPPFSAVPSPFLFNFPICFLRYLYQCFRSLLPPSSFPSSSLHLFLLSSVPLLPSIPSFTPDFLQCPFGISVCRSFSWFLFSGHAPWLSHLLPLFSTSASHYLLAASVTDPCVPLLFTSVSPPLHPFVSYSASYAVPCDSFAIQACSTCSLSLPYSSCSLIVP